jgi:hypothetical protein
MLQLIALLLILYQGLLELVLSQTMFFLEASPDDGFIYMVCVGLSPPKAPAR